MSDDGKCNNCGSAMVAMTIGNKNTSMVVMSCPKGCGILAHGRDGLFEHVDRAANSAAARTILKQLVSEGAIVCTTDCEKGAPEGDHVESCPLGRTLAVLGGD